MARTVVVMCDVHLEEGQRVEAEELPPITIEGKGPRVLALCPEHKRDYYDPFKELVEDLAQELPEANAGDGTSTDDAPSEQPTAEEEPAEDTSDETPDQGQEFSRDDPEQVIAETPAMAAVPDQPDTARWECPLDDCDKTYSASGDSRAEDLKRLGNLHLSTSHHLDKAARLELLSA